MTANVLIELFRYVLGEMVKKRIHVKSYTLIPSLPSPQLLII